MAAGMRTGLGDDWIRLGALKILADGSMGSGTAAFFEPYVDDPATTGLLLFQPDELERLIREADAAGFQLAVHAIGDRANSLVLDAFEKAAARPTAPATGASASSTRSTCAKADLAALPRAGRGRLGAALPLHRRHALRGEAPRARRDCPTPTAGSSFLDAGVTVAFGTDWFVEPLDPRLGLYAAVTREFPEGGPAGGFEPQEKITLEDALDLYTRGSAFAEFAEERKGTLEPGKLADLVVFGADLFALPAARDPAGRRWTSRWWAGASSSSERCS